MKPSVSVIILVYKVEKFIEQCARCLFEQTLEDIEYIFVDDCSPDASIEILNRVLEDYPARRSQVKILHNEVNRGQAFSRDRGVSAATGEYIIHCDSDDYPSKNLYETLLSKARETGADIVICDYNILQDGNITYGRGCRRPGMDPFAAILYGSIPAYPWNKLVLGSLYSKVAFHPVANIGEDKAVLVQLFYFASKVAFVPEPLYTYRLHDGGTCRLAGVHGLASLLGQNLSVILDFMEANDLVRKYHWAISAMKAEVQINSFALPWREYIAIYPENRFRLFFIPGFPLEWKLGHLTKLLGIHGISRLFRRK